MHNSVDNPVARAGNWLRHRRGWPLVSGLVFLVAAGVQAATMGEAEELFRRGEYSQCARLAAKEIDRDVQLEAWRQIKARAELAMGEYATARSTIEAGLDDYPLSIQLRWLAHRVYLLNDQAGVAEAQLTTLEQLARRSPRRYSSPHDRLVLGAYFLRRGADARQILELFYDPVLKQVPEFVDAHLASAQLAIDKYDNGLASQILLAAPEAAHEEPRYHYLVARAYMADDASRAAEALQSALEINPRHAESLLLHAERLIDGEQYEEAQRVLDELSETNPAHPVAWAFQAVLANLLGNPAAERAARQQALAPWSTNPEIDFTIGRKLSDKYRFAEGASYQRRALALDLAHPSARMQLAQDLLRLGREKEGWQLIHEVFDSDGYNVVAHNLVRLHDQFDKYRVLTNDSFRVRMDAREAAIYGERVLDLLDRAKETLCAKYSFEFDQPVTVEIFPEQKDFAVRTFGLPGAAGFLGVCFGNVITANSPAALGAGPANWEAVLWHELCHVVTLGKSRNKMPRWLSEGISVFEELQQDPTWGQRMIPTYRQMILDLEMAPLSELSSAFLAPKSAQHLQFAYFESALAVEYLVDNYGHETLKKLLDDLAEGSSMNEALIRHVAPLGKLDADFTRHVRKLAENMAPELTWEEVDLPPAADAQTVSEWLKDHPDNFFALVRLAQAHLREKNWKAALEPARRIRELFPEYVEAGHPYAILARANRELDEVEAEREVLEAWTQQDSAAVDAYVRLMELGAAADDWEVVERNAKQLLAVDPLTPVPHRYLARAAEALDRPADAIAAYRALLEFETSDPVNAHFRLAKLLQGQGQATEARREVLLALEDAPRFLDAHRLLIELVDAANQTDTDESR